MSKQLFKVLHIEDEGEYRRFFQTDVLRADRTPFRAVHLNRVEEHLSDEELATKAIEILGVHTDIRFVVVDLAMDINQHSEFDRIFATDEYPSVPPDQLPGGIGIVARILRDTEFPPQNMAFLTRHAPSSLFTKLDYLTKHWFGASIPQYLKNNADDVASLQEHIEENIGWVGSTERAVAVRPILPNVRVVVACISRDQRLLETVENEVTKLWDEKLAHYEPIKITDDGVESFGVLQGIVDSELQRVVDNEAGAECVRAAIFAVIDLISNQAEKQIMVSAVDKENWEALLTLPRVKQLADLVASHSAKNLKRLLKVVVLTSSVVDPHQWLERSLMRKLGVDYVFNQQSMNAEFMKKTVGFVLAIQPLGILLMRGVFEISM